MIPLFQVVAKVVADEAQEPVLFPFHLQRKQIRLVVQDVPPTASQGLLETEPVSEAFQSAFTRRSESQDLASPKQSVLCGASVFGNRSSGRCNLRHAG